MKRKIWLPLLTATATIATVVPTITSCRLGLMGTHDMLEPNYIHHVIPSPTRTVKTNALFVDSYFKDVCEDSDIIKDDILFTYSKLLTNDTYKSNLDFDFTRYFLYIDNIKTNLDEGQIDFELWAEITGSTKTAKISSHKTSDNKYLRNFTVVLSGHYSLPFTIDDTFLIDKDSEGPFKDLKGIRFTISSETSLAARVCATGVVGLSDTESGNITETAINEDETSLVSSKTDLSNLFDDLIYLIPSKALEQSDSNFYLMSYYFKNVKVVA